MAPKRNKQNKKNELEFLEKGKYEDLIRQVKHKESILKQYIEWQEFLNEIVNLCHKKYSDLIKPKFREEEGYPFPVQDEKGDLQLISPLDLGKSIFEKSYSKHMLEHFHVQASILKDFSRYIKNTVFDLGCGPATVVFALYFRERYENKKTSKLVGIDDSSCMLLQAYKNAKFLREKGLDFPVKFYQSDISQLEEVVKKEGNPDTIIISYCFHWLNKIKGLVKEVLRDIYHHLKKRGYFISIEEWPLRIGFEQNPVNHYIREKIKPINLEEELYHLIRSEGFVEKEETVFYDIDTQQKLEQSFDSEKHEHVMYGKVFQKS